LAPDHVPEVYHSSKQKALITIINIIIIIIIIITIIITTIANTITIIIIIIIVRKLAPDHVPEVYHFNKEKALIIMRFVDPPNQILRRALIQGLKITTFAPHLGMCM
jgi:5-methylthioribose kinase